MFCFHRWGPLEGNKQFCTKCGKVYFVPCQHIWEERDTSYYGAQRDANGKIYRWTSRMIRFRCTLCGEQKQESFE